MLSQELLSKLTKILNDCCQEILKNMQELSVRKASESKGEVVEIKAEMVKLWYECRGEASSCGTFLLLATLNTIGCDSNKNSSTCSTVVRLSMFMMVFILLSCTR